MTTRSTQPIRLVDVWISVLLLDRVERLEGVGYKAGIDRKKYVRERSTGVEYRCRVSKPAYSPSK